MRLLLLAAAGGAALAVASCATMSKDQCLAGAWERSATGTALKAGR